MGRARCRGTPKLQVQLLVGATAVNLKRLAHRLPAAGEGYAAGGGLPTTGACAGAHSAWTYEICLN